MQSIVRLFKSILKAAIFFTLFAFALNNQENVTVHFFFGHQWTAPMVLVVLGAFTCGLVIGMVGMVPRWWIHRRRHTANEAPVQGVTPPAEASRLNEPELPPHGV